MGGRKRQPGRRLVPDVPEAATDGIAATSATPSKPSSAPEEIGGRDGPDPTRYGDWEVDGRCVDF